MLKTLYEIADIYYGKSPNDVRSDIGVFPIIGTSGIVGKSSEALFDRPAVVVGRKGTLDNPILSSTPFWAIDTTYAVLPKTGVNIRWLFYCLLSANLKSLNEATGVPSLSRDSLGNLNFYVPPVDEQEAIATILDTIDEAIAAAEAQLAKQEKIKQGVLQDLLTRGIDGTGQIRPHWENKPDLYKKTELGWLPKEWEVKRLNQANIEIIDGDRGANYPHYTDFASDGFCLFLTAKNVAKNGFAFRELQFISAEKDQKLGNGKLIRGDIVITTRGTVGNIAYYYERVSFENVRINSGMLIIRNHDKNIENQFLYNSFRYFIFENEYKKMVSGSAQPQLPVKDFCKFNVMIPKHHEQNVINKLIEEANAPVGITFEEIQKLKKIKTGLMQDLLTSQRRVTPELIRQVEILSSSA